ncbi:uncharacterized protein DEA37_0014442, partial [Paragonimus westermani]
MLFSALYLNQMSFGLFMMEVAAWTVKLSPNIPSTEIGAIVKFLNFQPFEFFHGIRSFPESNLNSTFHVRHSKTALFRCDLNSLRTQLATTPLYVVVAQWPKNQSTEVTGTVDGQRLIGVVTISLNTFQIPLDEEESSTEGIKVNEISGTFVIRDLLGHRIGQIEMRIHLSRLPEQFTTNTQSILVGENDLEHRSCSEEELDETSDIAPIQPSAIHFHRSGMTIDTSSLANTKVPFSSRPQRIRGCSPPDRNSPCPEGNPSSTLLTVNCSEPAISEANLPTLRSLLKELQ